MMLSWFNTSVGTHKLYLVYEYVQYKAMQDIREIKLRDVDQIQTTRYVSRFEPLLYVPAFTQKDFHYIHTGPSTKGPSPRNYNSTLGVHYTSLNHNHLYTRGIRTKLKLNQLYIRGIGTKPKLNHNYLYTRGIGTNSKLNHNHLYTIGIGTNPQSSTIITSTQEG